MVFQAKNSIELPSRDGFEGDGFHCERRRAELDNVIGGDDDEEQIAQDAEGDETTELNIDSSEKPGGFNSDVLNEAVTQTSLDPPSEVVAPGSTTVQGEEESRSCLDGDIEYAHGEEVISEDPCKRCQCRDRETDCAIEECIPPSGDCVAIGPAEGQCCPTYKCEVSKTYQEVPFKDGTDILDPGIFNTSISLDDQTVKGVIPESEKVSENSSKSGEPSQNVFNVEESKLSDVIENEVKDGGSRPRETFGTSSSAIAGEVLERPVVPQDTIELDTDSSEKPDGINSDFLNEESTQTSRDPPSESVTHGTTLVQGNEEPWSCLEGTVEYLHKESVLSGDPCKKCQCHNGKITCAIQECTPPPINCRAISPVEGQCCPSHECLEDKTSPQATTISSTSPGSSSSQTSTSDNLGAGPTESSDGTNIEPGHDQDPAGVGHGGHDLTADAPAISSPPSTANSVIRNTASSSEETTSSPKMPKLPSNASSSSPSSSSSSTTMTAPMQTPQINNVSSEDPGIEDIPAIIDSMQATTERGLESRTEPEATDEVNDATETTDEVTDEVTEVTIATDKVETSSPIDYGITSERPILSPDSDVPISGTQSGAVLDSVTDSPFSSTTTAKSIMDGISRTQNQIPTNNQNLGALKRSCLRDDVEYMHKDEVSSNDPCQICQCYDGEITCSVKECIPPAENCTPVSSADGQCCPTYECPAGENDTSDSTRTPESISSTTSNATQRTTVFTGSGFPDRDLTAVKDLETLKSCLEGGVEYNHGENFTSKDPCELCQCYNGEITCSLPECKPSPGGNCKPVRPAEGECCPTYECQTYDEKTSSGVTATNTITIKSTTATTAPTPMQSTTSGTSKKPPLYSVGLDTLNEDVDYDDSKEVEYTTRVEYVITTESIELSESTSSQNAVTEQSDRSKSCNEGDVEYSHGETFGTSTDPCRVCQCFDTEVTCAVKECLPPLLDDCQIIAPSLGECCPTYECQASSPVEATTLTNIPSKTQKTPGFTTTSLSTPIAATLIESMESTTTWPTVSRPDSTSGMQDFIVNFTDRTPASKPASVTPSTNNIKPLEDQNITHDGTNTPYLKPIWPSYPICTLQGVMYKQGEQVADSDPCKLCQCLNGEISCAFKECPPQPGSCNIIIPAEGQCCPTYECEESETPISAIITTTSTTTKTTTAYTTTTSITTAATTTTATTITSTTTTTKTKTMSKKKVTTVSTSTKSMVVTTEFTYPITTGFDSDKSQTMAEQNTSTIPSMSPKSCYVNNVEYLHNQEFVIDDQCQRCQCFDGEVACATKECLLPPSSECIVVDPSEGECCQTYDCQETELSTLAPRSEVPASSISTLETDSVQTLATSLDENQDKFPQDTSTVPSASPKRCFVGDVGYIHEEEVVIADPCQKCQCFDGELSCATKECSPPPSVDCREIAPPLEECCPTFECEEMASTTLAPRDTTPSIPVSTMENSHTPSLTTSSPVSPTIVIPFTTSTTTTPISTTDVTTSETSPATTRSTTEATTSTTTSTATLPTTETLTTTKRPIWPITSATSTSTAVDTSLFTTATSITPTTPTPNSCFEGDIKYFDGETIIREAPCSLCQCLSGEIVCADSECKPPPSEDCKTMGLLQCCPVYECGKPDISEIGAGDVTSTTTTISTTTSEPPMSTSTMETTRRPMWPTTKALDVSKSCYEGGMEYLNGQSIAKEDPCNLCQCLKGEVACAIKECPPLPSDNCRSIGPADGQCCPSFECQEGKPPLLKETSTVVPQMTTFTLIEEGTTAEPATYTSIAIEAPITTVTTSTTTSTTSTTPSTTATTTRPIWPTTSATTTTTTQTTTIRPMWPTSDPMWPISDPRLSKITTSSASLTNDSPSVVKTSLESGGMTTILPTERPPWPNINDRTTTSPTTEEVTTRPPWPTGYKSVVDILSPCSARYFDCSGFSFVHMQESCRAEFDTCSLARLQEASETVLNSVDELPTSYNTDLCAFKLRFQAQSTVQVLDQYLDCVDNKNKAEEKCKSNLDMCSLEKLQDASVTVLKELAASIDDYDDLPRSLLGMIYI